MENDAPRSESLPPGFDEEDPYAGEDLSTYPDWWRRNIREFREHEMRPYRPPRFADDQLVPPLMMELEEQLDVTIEFRDTNPAEDDRWQLRVDGECVSTIGHHREGKGYTLYEIDSSEFETLIRETVEE